MNTNKIELTGTVERLQMITTKSGKPMARFLLAVGQDKFRVVAFGNLAGIVMAAGRTGNGTAGALCSGNPYRDLSRVNQ